MTSGVEASILAAARRARAAADAAEVELLEQAIAWADAHVVDADGWVATWGDTPVPIAGQGAPHISQFCIAEFAAAVRLSTDSGRVLLAEAVELAHRLPRVIAQVRAGRLRVWRARQIAAATLPLSPEAAAYVDHAVSFSAAKISRAALQRLVDEAIARHMPEHAAQIAHQAADQRHVTIEHQQVSFQGTSRFHGELDLADALDLDKALQAGAAQLAELGSAESLDARRALALGAMARGDQTLEYPVPPAPQREVVLHVHVNAEAVSGSVSTGSTTSQSEAGSVSTGSTTGEATGHAFVENHKRLVTLEQVRAWCGTAGKVTIRPVLDLHTTLTTEGYAIPEKIREHVIARDRTCIFPDCERHARSADLDHIEPYDPHGPPDQTNTTNLAPLCRGHHRLKTFSGWTYQMLTPRPLEPPGQQSA